MLDLAHLDVAKVARRRSRAAPLPQPARTGSWSPAATRSPPAPSSRVVVRYAGHPKPLVRKQHGDAGLGGADRRRDRRRRSPTGSPTWFPCNDRPDDKATYRISVTTDPGYLVVANGRLVAPHPARQQRDLGARAGRADGDRTSRPSRSAGTPTGSRPGHPTTASRCRIVAPADLDPAAFGAAFERQHEMVDVFSRAVRSVSVLRRTPSSSPPTTWRSRWSRRASRRSGATWSAATGTPSA